MPRVQEARMSGKSDGRTTETPLLGGLGCALWNVPVCRRQSDAAERARAPLRALLVPPL